MNNKARLINFLWMCFPMMLMAQQTLYQKKNFVKDGDTLRYRIMLPIDFSEEKNYPLVLFLHGAGERGSDNESQLIHGGNLFASEENREKYPAVVIFPQCEKDNYWSNVEIDRSDNSLKLKFNADKEPTKAMALVMELLQEYINKPYIDQQRLYVGGLSMGGMGTFELLSRMPNTFAAAIPICGGGSEELAYKYIHVPLWIFHGAKDDVVNPNHSVKMVKALLDAGGTPNFTLYENANHNSWDAAFAEPEFLSWLFSKNKSN